ncbi:MAG: DUF4433 domain-containing protein [Butyrivibrio sp.]|nr:DUF4433 domain-containing protein [Butyrivibrio sp.]
MYSMKLKPETRRYIARCIVNKSGPKVVSDRNASSDYASFYTPDEGLDKLDFEIINAWYWTDEDPYAEMRKKSIKCAEVLVPNSISYERILRAAVYSQNAKDKMIALGFDRWIDVEPKLFF